LFPGVLVNSSISHYRVLDPLGSGGNGVVYRAEDTVLHRMVALKFLQNRAGANDRGRERLRREARTASALNHPNICSIYEVGDQDGEIFIAMEFIDGRPLAKLAKQEGMAPSSVILYGMQIAAALEYAHGHGVVHGDIKPLNVLITKAGDAKVLDFGLARRTDPHEFDKQAVETITSDASASLAGTFPYMAPEQLEASGITPQTDIWSLGIVLYELAAGARPFHGTTLFQLCTAISREQLPPLPAHVPLGLATVIERCLEKDPARRYQRAGEVCAALQAITSSQRGRVEVSRDRRKVRWLAVAVVVVLLGAAGALAVYRGRSAARERGIGAVAAQPVLGVLSSSASSRTEQAAFENGLADTLTSRLGELSPGERLDVIPISEMREKHISSVGAARQQLGATVVLTLSVQRADQQLRVNYALVDTSTKRQIRSGTVTANQDDSFGLQDRVFESVVTALNVPTNAERNFAGAGGALQPAAYDFYLQGLGYLQDYFKPENVENAIAVFRQAIALHANFAAAQAGLGEAFWRKYQVTHDKSWVRQAVNSCGAAAKNAPQMAAAHSCLGRVFLGTGDNDKALEQYREALKLKPADETIRGGLAQTYERLGRSKEAEETYKQAIAMRPNYWATYNWLGLYYQHSGRYDEARQMYSRVVELAPDSFMGYSNLGGVYVLQGKYQEAIPVLEHSLQVRPTAFCYSNLATALFQMRRYAEAAGQFEQAVKLDPEDYPLWGNLGDAYYWSDGKRAEAQEAYGKAIRLGQERLRVNPHDAEVLSYVAMYHAMRGENAAALKQLQASLGINDKSTDLLLNAGIVYAQLGDSKRAMEMLQKAVAGGVPGSSLRDMPNFDGLKDQAEFQQLLKR
jgi:tetratricopeptide (TPR) repeat protein/TolB-like protein/predicted Ser/Thr protein kinase